MRKTTNYNLSQYDATDRVTRESFNADNAAVDAALKAIATAAANAGSAASAAQTTANSANSAAATAQSTANTAKSNAATAQSTANTAKTNAATAQSTAESAQATANSALALAQAAAAAGGNCSIETGTYEGIGRTNHTLTFSHPPLFVVIMRTNWANYAQGLAAVSGVPCCHARYADYVRIAYCQWTDNSLTLTGNDADTVMDGAGKTFRYVALYSV